jgi:putative spermidine/putrescine transport system permease protein
MNAPVRAWGDRLLILYLVVFFVFLESPLMMILLTSMNKGVGVTFPPQGWSSHWYLRLWDEVRDVPGLKPGLMQSVGTSLWLGLSAMAGSVVAGVLIAFGLHRYRFPGRAAAQQCFLLPILFPQVVTGVALALWFSAVHGVPVWTRLVLAHLILTLPYVVIATTASLETLDQRLEDVAMNLGADPLRTFWHITLPGIRSGIISGAVFAWLISFANFTVTFFLYGGAFRPLPVWIYEVIQYFLDPSLAALSTGLVLFTLTVLLILNRVFALGRLLGQRR